MVDFTVAICTYNGEQRLPEVLDKLRAQEETEELSWEILVIDNNSKDKTAEVVREYQSRRDRPYPVIYCFEPEQGLAFARRHAIREAKSDLIGFLDDDNLPDPSWVAEAYKFGLEHPSAGAYGGQIRGEFEVDPPEGFDRIARYFAILEGNKTYCYNERYKNTRKKMYPPGAGIVIRKQAWLNSVPERQKIAGVAGNSLATKCEDVEMLSYLLYGGWELWFNHQMIMYHKIPCSRLSRDYILRFFKGVGMSRYETRMIAYKPWQRIIMIPAYFVNDVRKIIVHFWKYRDRLDKDVIAAGEMEFLINVCLSCFNYCQKTLLDFYQEKLSLKRFYKNSDVV
jgi:glycosyltransferase involved in cell wall biosynthesis